MKYGKYPVVDIAGHVKNGQWASITQCHAIAEELIAAVCFFSHHLYFYAIFIHLYCQYRFYIGLVLLKQSSIIIIKLF